MNNNRRDFLKKGGSLAAGLALAPIAGKLMMNENEIESAKKLKTFGLQLYSLRDVLPKYPKEILKQVAEFGYKQLEGYEGAKGMFWGMSNIEFKKYMDDLGMNFVSSHCETNKDFEKKVADAASIGMKYIIYPYEGPNKTMDDYKKLTDDFNKKGEICKKNGIRFAFHNHDFSFRAINGVFPQDVLMQNTDPSLVDFEMDMYWVVTAGQDPVAWLKKYPNRFPFVHVKDRTIGATATADTCILGQGSINYHSILKEARKLGVKYYIVEQEKYANTTPIDSAKADAEYMKKMKI
ncbi:MAG: TIM barrel protein [Bacteroidota bacterium]